MGNINAVLDSYSRRYGLSPSQRQLLQHSLSGLDGAALASAMRVRVSEVKTLETLFQARTGRSLEQAVREIRGVVRSRSRHPSVG